MHKITSAQLTALAGVARSLDRLQAAIDDPSRAWTQNPVDLSYSVAGVSFQVDADQAMAAMVKQRDLLVQHLELHGFGWQPTQPTQRDKPASSWGAGQTGTHWQSGTKPPSWYDQAQGG